MKFCVKFNKKKEESLLNVLDVQQHYIHAYQIKYKNIISWKFLQLFVKFNVDEYFI